MDNTEIDTSIVIPVYNSSKQLERSLPVLLNSLNASKKKYEVLLIDDGSTDEAATQTLAEQFSCRYYLLNPNQGKGAAVKFGMLKALGRYRIFTDADLPFQPDSIELGLQLLKTGAADIALGDRTLPDSNYFNEIPKTRLMGSRIFSKIVALCMLPQFNDTQCGLKGFKAEAAIKLFTISKVKSFAFDVEIILIALQNNYKISKFPVRLRSQSGNSVNILKHSVIMLLDLITIKLNSWRGIYKLN